MNCVFVGGCDSGWPAMRSSKPRSGCRQQACTRVRKFRSTQPLDVWKCCAVCRYSRFVISKIHSGFSRTCSSM